MDLETRVRRLEGENRVLRYGGLLVVAVVLISEAAVAQHLEDIEELSVLVEMKGTDLIDESSVRNRVEVALRRNGIGIDASVNHTLFGISITTLRATETAVSGVVQISLYREAFVRTDSRWDSLDYDNLRDIGGNTIETKWEVWQAVMQILLERMDLLTVWSDAQIVTASTTAIRSMIFDAIDELMDSFNNDYLEDNQRSP